MLSIISVLTSVISYPATSGTERPIVEDIPSDWESGGSKGVTCVVSKEENEIPSEWESGGSKGVTCIVA
jgi:hypothetical protein